MLSNIKCFFYERVIGSKSLKTLLLGLTDKFMELALTFVAGIIVIRCLNIEDYAIIGILAGYSSVINFFAIAPENYLLKVLGNLKKEDLPGIVNSYFLFDVFLGGLLALVYFLLGVFLFFTYKNIGFLIVGATQGITVFFTNLYNLFRLVLEIDFRQKKLLVNTFKVKVFSLAVSLLLIWKGTLWMYFLKQCISIFVQFLSIFMVYRKELAYEIQIPSKIQLRKNIKTAFLDFALINHIIGCLTNIIYSGETIFMSWFMGLTVIGQYNIALTAINYLVIPFQIIQKYCSIELGGSMDRMRNMRTVRKYVIYACVFQGAILGGYVVWGKVFVSMLTENSIDLIYLIGLVILIGTAIYNIIRPISCYLIYKTSLWKYCFYVIVPSLIINCIGFYILARYTSIMWVAVGNIVSYSLLTLASLYRFYIETKKNKNTFKLGMGCRN